MSLLRLAIASLMLVAAAGCGGPTYHKERLTGALQELFASEHLTASVRFLDHTLAVQVEYPDTLVQTGDQVSIGPGLDEALHKVLPALHRVLLSTDARVAFYVLLVSDPHTPGVYLTMVRYLDDVRRANANMLDTPEMASRTVFDLNYVGPDRMTIEQYVPRDIHLEEFLSWQLARRIQGALTAELQDPGMANVGRCGGEFRDGEFAFTLNVIPQGTGSLDDDTLRKVFHTSTAVIAKVLSSYHFDAYTAVRLIYPPTGRNLVLPKTSLDLFR